MSGIVGITTVSLLLYFTGCFATEGNEHIFTFHYKFTIIVKIIQGD
jgi:hypothetical protein